MNEEKSEKLEGSGSFNSGAIGPQSAAEIVFEIDGKGIFLDYRQLGDSDLVWFSGNVIGKTIYDVAPTDMAQLVMQCIEKTLLTKDHQIFEYQHRINNNWHYLEVRFIFKGEDRVIVIVRDITIVKNATEHIMHLAYYDALTDLPNRFLFKDRLNHSIMSAERMKKLIGIMFIDLDNFKRINDTLGHNVGDQLLQGIAGRLKKCIRKTDSITRLFADELESFVARTGGDEFTLQLTDVDHIQDIARASKRIINTFSDPFVIGSHEIFITASLGIAVYPFDGTDVDALLMNADVAMYQAKNQGRNNCQFYSASMNSLAYERFTMENKLWKALEQNEFCLFYQPQVNIWTGEIIGVEALIRWMQPDLILVKPKDFIPLAEETGLIVEIGKWVLHAACSQIRAWQEAGIKPMTITVNVSSTQFRQKGFVETVAQILSTTGLDPSYLQLELTEGTLMQNNEDTLAKLKALKTIGVKISIDDFGTGYSSLGYLKRFPISTLKIDRSFIHDIVTNKEDQTITKAIIDLGHNLNLNVIAEGVEMHRQLSFLSKHSCDGIQGYLICPPLNSDALMQFFKTKSYSFFCRKGERR